jgi:nucleoside-diphosphate-sugar epimerase
MSENMGNRLLLTGANGSLGHYISSIFSEYDITSLGLSENNDIVYDLTKTEDLDLNDTFDIAIHCAGSNDEQNAMDINLNGTKKLLSLLDSTPLKYFVYISHHEVYGKKEAEELDEDSHLWTSSKVGQSKALAEKYVTEWCKNHNVVLTILRPAAMFGRNMRIEWSKVFDEIVRGKYFNIRENIARRSVVTAFDVARVAKMVYAKGGIYNVSDGSNPLVNELTQAIGENGVKMKRPFVLPLKWAKIASHIAGLYPLTGLSKETLQQRMTTFTLSTNRLSTDYPDFKFHKTTEVLRHSDIDYPYEDD